MKMKAGIEHEFKEQAQTIKSDSGNAQNVTVTTH